MRAHYTRETRAYITLPEALGTYTRPPLVGAPRDNAEGPAGGRPAAVADGRAHASRRPRRELLVSPPPGGLSLDRRPLRRPRRGRHGLRRGLRQRGPGRARRARDGRRRQPGGARARAAQVYATGRSLRTRPRGGLRRAVRR